MVGDSYGVSYGFLTVDDEDFSVGEVLHQTVNVFFAVHRDLSLVVSCLVSQSLVLRLNQLKSGFDYLGVGLDVKSVHSSGKVLHMHG